MILWKSGGKQHVKKQKRPYSKRRSRKNQEKILPWALGGSVLIIIGLIIVYNLGKPGTDEPGPRSYEKLFGITGTSESLGATENIYPDPGNLGTGHQWLPALGDPDAPVTFIEFSDPFCGHCRTFNLEYLEGILNDYVATGQVRYVDHFFGAGNTVANGTLDAMFCAAEQGHYFEYKHSLFQAIEVNAFDLQRSARVSGLDMKLYRECVNSDRYKAALLEMVYDHNREIEATPTFFINGVNITGNKPDEIRQTIEEALRNSNG
jgi:hypothetical protein